MRPTPGGGRRTAKTTIAAPTGHGSSKPRFSFEYADRAYVGAWGWPDADAAHELLTFICEMGQCTWSEIDAHMTGGKDRHRKHHSEEFHQVCKEARDRVAELRHDEVFEEFFRFRVGAKKRLWGFRREGVFYVVWWDPHHKVHPTDPD